MNMKKGFKNDSEYAIKLWNVLQGYKLLHYASFRPRSPKYSELENVAQLEDIFTTSRDVTDDFVVAVSQKDVCQAFIACADFL
jgi:hypothetical protein